MKVVVQNYYSFITTDGYLFREPQSDIGHNLLKPWNDLFLAADDLGIKLYTPDQLEGEVDLAIYMDVPRSRVPAKKSMLIIYEPPFLIPENWEPVLHDSMDRVMTWDDNLIDNKKYFKNNFTAELTGVGHTLSKEQFFLRKPLVMIQTNKQHSDPHCLYGKRIEAIQFFERKATSEFDLYGRGWEGRLSNCGVLSNKLKTLSNYRFCIAYENCDNAPGYITEKMLDCLLAGVVPIYWGAPNVTDHIPKDCFIDIRDFSSYEELLQFVHDVDYAKYLQYLGAMNTFLASSKSQQFRNDWYIKQLLQHIQELA